MNASKLEMRTSPNGIINGTMVIRNLNQDDRGMYTCNLTNHPSLLFSTSTSLRVKDMYAALWPFLGIIAEVVILCIVILIFEKRNSKAEYDDSETPPART